MTNLTPDQTATATSWLDKQWKNDGICPVCQTKVWQIGDFFVELRSYNSRGLTIGGPVYPLIAVTCSTCGLTLLFNAIMAGLIKPTAEESEKRSPLPGVVEP